jgi:uncharacterized protein (DUF1778 family)
MSRREATVRSEKRVRAERLGFRVDGRTKALVERAARLEQRKLTDFCLTVLTEAAQRAIARHEMLVLSERDRDMFFKTLINPPKLTARLKHAFEAERQRLAP